MSKNKTLTKRVEKSKILIVSDSENDKEDNLKRIVIRLTPEKHKELKVHCAQLGVSINSLLLDLIDKELGKKTK